MTRKCNLCQEIKDESEFYKDKNRINGIQHRCKTCCKFDTYLSKIRQLTRLNGIDWLKKQLKKDKILVAMKERVIKEFEEQLLA